MSMLQKIRIGKDISIEWYILTNGIALSLEEKELKLEITTPLLKKIALPITVSGNRINAEFPAKLQKATGVYSLTLWENIGKKGQTCVDRCSAFSLVSRTCQESCWITDTPCVTLCGNLFAGVRGESAYEAALRNGYTGSEREWLESLGYEESKNPDNPEETVHIELTQEQLILLQLPASQAAASLSALGRKLECVLESTEGVVENIEEIKKYEERLSNVEKEVFPLSVSVTGGGIFEKGTSRDITVQWTTRKGSEEVEPDSSTVNDIPAEGDAMVFNSVNNDTTYKVVVTKDGLTAESSTSARFISPMYFGFSESDNASILSITSLDKQSVKTSPAGTYTLNNEKTGNYMWLCVPSSMIVNRVTSSGFDIPMEAQQEGSTSVDTYKCYRSSSQINKGQVKIVIS